MFLTYSTKCSINYFLLLISLHLNISKSIFLLFFHPKQTKPKRLGHKYPPMKSRVIIECGEKERGRA